ncbi:sulfotransferase [Massilia sp. Root335]|jgi:sulfotransferase|uniref:sulfotransferase family protein n=1 Tax=Massilia sp. Root335 TaxID=1736517 RepID=UPI0006F77686|nr:sulfotransferase [Massilia sp. Root335]KQV39115.1 sulfotransferase [Massilia sp. Root335]
MPQTFHFISGLPRSGSTLLSGILLQNPRFHAGMTSPVGSLCSAVLGQVSAGSEFAPVVGRDKRRALLRGLFDTYYADVDRDIVFDTNRSWCAKMPLVHDLFPQAKVIACVRNVAWIMDSFERMYRANPYEHTRLFGAAGARGTVYSRLEGLAQHDQTVGHAWSALRDAFYGEHASSLLVVDYELLARAPAKVMRLVYEFLGEPYFEHDFDNVEYDAEEFDAQLGAPGLHKVKSQVKFSPRPTVIPPDLFDRFNQMSFWNDKAGSAANVIAVQPAQQGEPS